MIRVSLLIFLGILSFFEFSIQAQQQRVLSLETVITLARDQSPDAILAKHRFRGSYWQYRTHQADLLPRLSLNTTIPDLNRSIDKITLPDGTDAFVERRVVNSIMNLSLTQNIGYTGGNIFLNSDLQRIDLMGDKASTSYLSTPVSIGFRQPINGYNAFRWQKRIEPLRYEEARLNYLDAMERVATRAVNLFFDLALAQLNMEIARLNYSNSDTLYKIAQGRYRIGTIAENNLLQMELGLLNAGTALNRANIDLQTRMFQLRSFLGFHENVSIQLAVPNEIPGLEIPYEQALAHAKERNPEMFMLERLELEAQRDVASARSQRGINANLYATFGLTQRSDELQSVYVNPQDQQRVRVGVQLPIVDWGLGKGKYQMARSNEEVVRTQVNQALIDFEQNVFIQVMQFNLQDDQVEIAAKADTVAQLRYEVTKQRFLIGRIDVLDLNIAQTEKDVARRGYVQAIRDYWAYYYAIRRITLHDFLGSRNLDQDYDLLLK
jgi:outer membrane protein TolC